jgi:V/A-type H+-transporting ATPase subunit E
MGLDQVIEEVLAEGEREADAIVEEAREEADAIVQDAKERAEEEREERLAEAEQEADAERRRIEASAELEAKKKRLDAEADVLASVRSRVESRLTDLPQEEREPLVRTLIEDAGADEFGGDARAWAPKRDRDIVEDYGFTYEGEIDALGGVVIESPDGRIREDLTFDTLLDEVWRDRMHEVALDVLEQT